MWVLFNWLLCLWKKSQLPGALSVNKYFWSPKSLSPLFPPVEMACTEYSTVPETPEAQRTMKESYFQRQRGVQFLDVSDSEDEEPRNVRAAAREPRAPRAREAVMYALSQLSLVPAPKSECWTENLSLGWESAAPNWSLLDFQSRSVQLKHFLRERSSVMLKRVVFVHLYICAFALLKSCQCNLKT